MEKSSDRQKRQFCNRLLISVFLLLSALPGFAKPLTNSQIKDLVIEPDTPQFFTAQENGYTVCFDGIDSSSIQTDLNTLPPGVQFVSSKRSSYVNDEGERGTMIQFWFSFTDVGPVKLPPLIVRINKRTFYLPFGDVTVYENPALISPVLEVDFGENIKVTSSRNGVKTVKVQAGQKINFTLKIKYCVQIMAFNWTLPKDSIFTETKRYEIAEGNLRTSEFSAESVSVADFEWNPLVAGTYSLPQLEIKALSYSGAQRTIYMPEYEIVVTGKAASKQASPFIPAESLYSSAWDQEESAESLSGRKIVTLEDCHQIARLRSAERHSFELSSARKNRQQFEEAAGIPDALKEHSYPVMWVEFAIAIVCFGMMVIFFILKRYKASVALFIVWLVFTLITISDSIDLHKEYGIFCGGEVWTVPEPHTSNTKTVSPGLRVRISGHAGEWYYVEASNISGWVPETSVLLIQ